jgi:hypothetical protein
MVFLLPLLGLHLFIMSLNGSKALMTYRRQQYQASIDNLQCYRALGHLINLNEGDKAVKSPMQWPAIPSPQELEIKLTLLLTPIPSCRHSSLKVGESSFFLQTKFHPQFWHGSFKWKKINLDHREFFQLQISLPVLGEKASSPSAFG